MATSHEGANNDSNEPGYQRLLERLGNLALVAPRMIAAALQRKGHAGAYMAQVGSYMRQRVQAFEQQPAAPIPEQAASPSDISESPRQSDVSPSNARLAVMPEPTPAPRPAPRYVDSSQD